MWEIQHKVNLHLFIFQRNQSIFDFSSFVFNFVDCEIQPFLYASHIDSIPNSYEVYWQKQEIETFFTVSFRKQLELSSSAEMGHKGFSIYFDNAEFNNGVFQDIE